MGQVWWVSTAFATFGVVVNDGIITDAAPIGWKFIGQPIERLLEWKQVLDYRQIGGCS